MIPIWAKTMNKAWNLDIVNIKNNQIFNDYVVVAGSLNNFQKLAKPSKMGICELIFCLVVLKCFTHEAMLFSTQNIH